MFQSNYIAKVPDAQGYVDYTGGENKIWQNLYARQIEIVQSRACDEYLNGLKILAMPQNRIPQLAEMNKKLMAATGWQVEAVPALIPHSQFFNLLAHKKFPAATFIRRREQFDYITEPDIFHEFFGHCPMLTYFPFAKFMQKFGELGIQGEEPQQNLLARLYWFTVEFGLIQTRQGLKIYGGGILSSPEETIYALESNIPKRLKMNIETVLATDFRIDVKQPHYFVIDSFDELYSILNGSLVNLMHSMV